MFRMVMSNFLAHSYFSLTASIFHTTYRRLLLKANVITGVILPVDMSQVPTYPSPKFIIAQKYVYDKTSEEHVFSLKMTKNCLCSLQPSYNS